MEELISLEDSQFNLKSIGLQIIESIISKISDEITTRIKTQLEEIIKLNIPQEKEDELITIKELEELSKRKRTTIYNWKKKGTLRPIAKSGNSPLYSKKEVVNFLKSNYQISIS